MLNPVCPVHDCEMLPSNTRFGVRFECNVFPCTVAQWSGSTSTPADQATREARIAAHTAFDQRWNSKRSRRKAYRWLCEAMQLSREECHIGMFDADQCQRVVELCKEYS